MVRIVRPTIERSRIEERLLSGSPQAVGDSISNLLSSSWRRSIEHGLRREDSVLFTNPVSKALARRTIEENRRLLCHVTPEMLRLYDGLGSTQWLALCLNVRGQVICSVGDPISAPKELRALMHPGRSLLESEIGTTAPGCVLEHGHPVVVSGEEHYLHELASFFCASAPLLGPDGNLIGALDLSGIDIQAAPMAANMVALAARHIENSLLTDMGDCVLLHFHFDDRLLGTPSEALLAVTPSGRMIGANRTARQLLALKSPDAEPSQLETLFETGIDHLLSVGSRGPGPLKIRSNLGAIAHIKIDSARPSKPNLGPSRSERKAAPKTPCKFVLRDKSLIRSLGKATVALTHGLPVLLQGETGTGKELFARALHENVRPAGPFLALNCAAIPEGLIEAELFGYAEGAFTGGRKGGAKGKVELASGGILFLDEIGDMPLTMQSRLLRVLQERTIMRIGADRELAVDTLFVSATHHHLGKLSARGAFREDLFYRLSGFTLRISPLRERTDILDIVESLLRRDSGTDHEAMGDMPLERIITPEALSSLLNHPWPGNIRQLEQTIRRLCAFKSRDRAIDISDVEEQFPEPETDPKSECTVADNSSTTYKNAQDDIVKNALRDHADNIAATARALGISRTTIYKKIREWTCPVSVDRLPP